MRMQMTLTPRRGLCRLAVVTGALCLMSACTDVSMGSLETVKQAVHGGTSVHPTAESVAAEPYYQLQVEAPGGEAILLLASVQGDLLGWYGPDGQAVFLKHGVLVKTLGLTRNLDAMQLEGDPFAGGLQHVQAPVTYRRVMDWSPDYHYGIHVQAQLQPMAMENVDILGTVHRLRRFDEHLRAAETGFDVVNRYWVDPVDGFIWKSRQYAAPGQALELIQLRPYRGPQT